MTTEPAPRAFRLARLLLGATLMLAPLPFGAVYGWAWGAITCLAVLILILWAAGSLRQGTLKIVYAPVYAPLALLLVWGCLQLALRLTYDGVATRESLLKFATDLVLFFLVIQLFADSPLATWRRVGIAVLMFGSVFSFLAIIQFLWNPARILWVGHDLAVIPFGPYVDRDHYAGLMEMVAAVSAAYAISRPRSDPLGGMLWFGVLIQMVSLFLTGSRGGIVSAMVVIALWGWVMIWRSPLRGGRMRIGAGGVAILAAAALFVWLAPGIILNRVRPSNSMPDVRRQCLAIWRGSFGIFRAHPLAGTGMGTFETAYPRYQTKAQDLITEHAHNDYVEAFTETGLLGGVLILLALVLFLRRAFGNLAARLRYEPGWMQLGGAIACCGLLVHSLVDFNLHIPANAAWFAFCAALASLSGSDGPHVPGRENSGGLLRSI